MYSKATLYTFSVDNISAVILEKTQRKHWFLKRHWDINQKHKIYIYIYIYIHSKNTNYKLFTHETKIICFGNRSTHAKNGRATKNLLPARKQILTHTTQQQHGHTLCPSTCPGF
jgi:hypothetical protein